MGNGLPYINGYAAFAGVTALLLVAYMFVPQVAGFINALGVALIWPINNPFGALVFLSLFAALVLKILDAPRVGSGQRFRSLERNIAKNPKVSNPGAVAASIGRAKYGKQKFQALAAAGRRRRRR